MPGSKPKSQDLFEVARRCKQVKFSFKLDSAPGFTELSVNVITRGFTWDCRYSGVRYIPPDRRENVYPDGKDLPYVLEQWGRKLAGFPITWSSLKVTSKGSPVKGSELKQLIVDALNENFAAPPAPSRWQEHHDRAVAALRAGVSAWAAIPAEERKAGLPFHGLDLSGLNLDGINFEFFFEGWDFKGSNFSQTSFAGASLGSNIFNRCNLEGANLSGCFLSGAKLHSANLKSARLVGARMMEARLRDANLQDADLSNADLRAADLCGADLTGAILEGAQVGKYNTYDRKGTRYDGRTRFPEGFVPGDGWTRHDEPEGGNG